MTTDNAIKTILSHTNSTDLIVCSLGRTAEKTFCYVRNIDRVLFLDCLGAPIGVGVGVALANSNSPVFSFETDGSFFYNMSVFNTIKNCEKQLANYFPIIFDNELLESGGGLSSATSGGFDWISMAKSWGVDLSLANNEDDISRYFSARTENKSFAVLVIKVNNSGIQNCCSKDIDGIESRYRFKRYINDNLRKGIIMPCIKN